MLRLLPGFALLSTGAGVATGSGCGLGGDGAPACATHDDVVEMLQLQLDTDVNRRADPEETSQGLPSDVDPKIEAVLEAAGMSYTKYCDTYTDYDWGMGPSKFGCKGPLELLMGSWEGKELFAFIAAASIFPPELMGDRQLNGDPFPNVYTADVMNLSSFVPEGKVPLSMPTVAFFGGDPLQGEVGFLGGLTDRLVFKPGQGEALNRYRTGTALRPTGEVWTRLEGISFAQSVVPGGSNFPEKERHAETGFLAYQITPETSKPISRISTIPHGIMTGQQGSFDIYDGPDATAELVKQLNEVSIPSSPQYGACLPSTVAGNLVPLKAQEQLRQRLLEHVANVSKVNFFVRIDLDEDLQVFNRPALNAQAPATNASMTMWVSSIQGEQGEEFMLQYVQRAFVDFTPRLDCLSCPNLSKDAEGCYAMEDLLVNGAECEVDLTSTSCAAQPKVQWPHHFVSSLRRVAAFEP